MRLINSLFLLSIKRNNTSVKYNMFIVASLAVILSSLVNTYLIHFVLELGTVDGAILQGQMAHENVYLGCGTIMFHSSPP